LALLAFDLIFLFLYTLFELWDIQKNIEEDAKEVQNIEEIKSVKRRNNYYLNLLF